MTSVDVLIPFYNDSEGFDRSLRSVESQTWDGRFRVVVVDDGSAPHESLAMQAMLDRAQLPFHTVINPVNRGRPYTRNVLLDCMESEYVAWLDSGDVWYPEKIGCQVGVVRGAPNGAGNIWATCSYDWCVGDLPPRRMWQNTEGDLIRHLLEGADLRAYLWTILAPRAAMEAVGYFDENLGRLQDLDFFIRFALKRGNMVQPSIQAPLCAYIKEYRGRSAKEINDCSEYLKQKYAHLYARYGRKFAIHCEYRAVKNSERFARANGEHVLRRTYKHRARRLKRQLWLGL